MYQRRRGNPQVVDSPSGTWNGGEEGGPQGTDNLLHQPDSGRQRRRQKNDENKKRMIFRAVAMVVTMFATVLPFKLWSNYALHEVHLPVPMVDISVPNEDGWPLIHIVNTRFMQEQGALITLGWARYYLFVSFCFPTMVQQTTQDFLWIIKTDPAFATTPVMDRMIQLVEPYPNIYLVASNVNYLVSPDRLGCWRDGAEGQDLLQSKIYTGNITKLHQAIALRNDRPILETRLDADDGLHREYLQYVQQAAMRYFLLPNASEIATARRWMYWCTRRHLEWHSSMDETVTTAHDSFGLLNPVQHSKLCATPGITVGYNAGVDSTEVPVHSHDQLYAKVRHTHSCQGEGEKKVSCLDLVEDIMFCAVRSRTLTSAGMRNVPMAESDLREAQLMEKMWRLLEKDFAVNQTMVQETQDFLSQHKKQIAYENLLGQCTTGHSCKEQAKQELQRYIERAKNREEDSVQLVDGEASNSLRRSPTP